MPTIKLAKKTGEKMDTKLGKIESAKFGLCGYQECELGLSVTISGDGWGISDKIGNWDFCSIKPDGHSEWSEEDRKHWYYQTMVTVSKLLDAAKVKSVSDLKGKPVEVTMDKNTLKSWRILTEVL